MKEKKFKKQSAFALIYTMLFVMLIVVTVLVSWATALADIRLQNRNQYSAEAYNLARAAVEDGWIKYHSDDGIDSDYPLPDINYPDTTAACAKVHIVYPNNTTPPVSPDVILQSIMLANDNKNESKNGFYAYRICTNSTSHKTTIEGIGYYKGTKVTLKADVSHAGDTPIMGADPNPPFGQIQTGWDHSADTMFIYQAGPSG